VDQGQPEAGTSVAGAGSIIDLIELIPDIFLVIRADADAGVFDPAVEAVILVSGADGDLALLDEFRGIVEE